MAWQGLRFESNLMVYETGRKPFHPACRKFTGVILSTLFISCGWTVSAYDIAGNKWIGGEAIFYVDIKDASFADMIWSAATIDALAEWSDKTAFQFLVVEEEREPCRSDSYNSIGFTDDVCGTEFGANTIAVTLNSYEPQVLGPSAIVESDIVVNSNREYAVYSGAIWGSASGQTVLDYRRVALHEFGHAIGLGHEENLTAIMAPTLSSVDELTEDDINGANRLYTGLSSCRIGRLSNGTVSGALEPADCTVKDMTVGGTDESLIDLFEFEVRSGTYEIEVSVESEELDTVLVLATRDLEYLAVDTQSINDCSSSLSKELGVGSYLLMVNTYDQPIKSQCGGSGQYTLKTNVRTLKQPELYGSASLSGLPHNATFSGGISNDNGKTFSNLFTPDDLIDISAKIAIDESHAGQLGFILVAAILSDQFLMLNEKGQFIDTGFNPQPFLAHKRKELEYEEEVIIATGLVPSELGIEEIEVNIVVGYGLDSDPTEVYYHQTPINLVIGLSAPVNF